MLMKIGFGKMGERDNHSFSQPDCIKSAKQYSWAILNYEDNIFNKPQVRGSGVQYSFD